MALVRKLIARGQELLGSLQGCEGPHPPLEVFRRFGCLSLTLVIARITRGLMIAAALEKRLLHPRPRPAGQAPRTEPAPPRAPRATRKPQPDEAEELLGALPSAREIAARIRNRKTGAVIADICRDLGIACDHPLWRELNELLCWCHPFNLWRMVESWRERGARLAEADPTLGSEMGIYPPPAAATHPP